MFTSLKPEDIEIEPTSSRGRKALKKYLEFSRTGRLETGIVSGRDEDSDFEVMVRARLKAAGYDAEPQVGVAGYSIDLAVRHPAHTDHFLLGVECDGAAFHSFKSARDRDRLRQEILERLGWKIHRIWSTDWFNNPEEQVNNLVAAIKLQERAFSRNVETHIDLASFSRVSPPVVQKRPVFSRDRGRPVKAPPIELTLSSLTHPVDEKLRFDFLRDLEDRRGAKWRQLFERSIPAGGAPSPAIDIPSKKTGKALELEREEQLTRLAFEWKTKNPTAGISGLPWIDIPDQNVALRLRELAIDSLLKAGKLTLES